MSSASGTPAIDGGSQDPFTSERMKDSSTPVPPRSTAGVAASFVQQAASDLLVRSRGEIEGSAHLDAAYEWLCRAHDATADDGVSYGYSLRGGWKESYRETTGYITTTFHNLADIYPSAKARAERMGEWLLSIQNEDGSISNPRYDKNRGIVFDTGQVLFGLVRNFEESGDERFLAAAQRAANWLVEGLDGDGAWRANTHLSVPHTYNTRVAWSMLRLNEACPDAKVEEAARANFKWAMSEEKNGWFESNAFRDDVAPFTHTIAYAIRGFLGAAEILDDKEFLEVAERTATAVRSHVAEDGFLPGQIDTQGRPAARYCCLTGNCQMAIIWLRLFRTTGAEADRAAAKRALGYVKRQQDLGTEDLARRGAIKGSNPIWGRYAPLSYPNWATKFFIDALMLEAETDAQ